MVVDSSVYDLQEVAAQTVGYDKMASQQEIHYTQSGLDWDYRVGGAENTETVTAEQFQIDSEHLSTESSLTTELICPVHTTSPEQLRQMKVTTLAMIGLVGLLIVGSLLVCMIYKNDRVMEALPSCRKKKKKHVPVDINLSLVVNTTLQTVPALNLPGLSSVGGSSSGSPDAGIKGNVGLRGLRKKLGKHFPTPKNMLLDVDLMPQGRGSPTLLPPSGDDLSLGHKAGGASHSPVAQHSLEVVPLGDTATATSRFPASQYQDSGAPHNESMMRRHPGAVGPGASLYGFSPEVSNAQGQTQQQKGRFLKAGKRQPDEESLVSWYSDETGISDESSFYAGDRRGSGLTVYEEEDDDDGGGGYHAESRRGARGERTRHSMKSKDRVSDKYGSSMASKRGHTAGSSGQEQGGSSGLHEVSYMSGRFW